MNSPTDPDADPDAWAGYTAALAVLHSARDAAAADVRAALAADVRRSEQLTALGTRLAHQQNALLALAADLRVPLTAADLVPTPGPPGRHPGPAVGDIQTRLTTADAAVAEARRVATLPQLLPAWSSPLARAAVVYAVFCVPNSVVTVSLAFTGETASRLVWMWFLLVWPALTALLGGRLVTQASRPRSAANDDDPLRRLSEIARRTRRWGPPYRALGALIAVASWYVPGFILEPTALGFS